MISMGKHGRYSVILISRLIIVVDQTDQRFAVLAGHPIIFVESCIKVYELVSIAEFPQVHNFDHSVNMKEDSHCQKEVEEIKGQCLHHEEALNTLIASAIL